MKKLILSILAIAAMTSCTKSSVEEIDPNAPVEIKFGSAITALGRAVIEANSAFNASVVRQDIAGEAAPTFASLTPISANVKAEGSVEITTQYYDVEDKIAYFIGFTSEKATIANTDTDSKIEYTGLDGQTDIMATAAISAGNKSNSKSVDLAYQHLLSQLQFKFKAANGFPSNTISVESLTIKGMQTNATLKLGETPTLTFSGETTSAYNVIENGEEKITTAGTESKFVTLVKAGLTSITLDIVAGGVNYSDIPVTLTTVASNAHVIELTFSAKSISNITASVGTWQTGSTGSGNIQQ